MNSMVLRAINVLLSVFVLLVGVVCAQPSQATPLVSDNTQFIVPVVNNINTRDNDALLTQKLTESGAQVIGSVGDFRPFWKVIIIRVNPASYQTVASKIYMTGLFSTPQPDYLYSYQNFNFTVPPTDPYFSSQAHLGQMKVPDAWQHLKSRNLRLQPVSVGLLDDCSPLGVDNPELNTQVVNIGFDAVNNCAAYFPRLGGQHATLMASTICGATNTSATVGVNPVAKVYPVYVGPNGGVRESSLMRGIQHCAKQGIKVICAGVNPGFQGAVNRNAGSLDGYCSTYYGYSNGYRGLAFFPAGNDGRDNPNYSPYGPIAVSALNATGTQLATFSNRGNVAVLSAPGESVYTSDFCGRVTVVSGTSIAAANAAGVASLVLGVAPTQPAETILRWMGGSWGYGRVTPPAVNALSAVQQATGTSGSSGGASSGGTGTSNGGTPFFSIVRQLP